MPSVCLPLIQIMSKKDMKTLEIESPNESDGVMMSLFKPVISKGWGGALNVKTSKRV